MHSLRMELSRLASGKMEKATTRADDHETRRPRLTRLNLTRAESSALVVGACAVDRHHPALLSRGPAGVRESHGSEPGGVDREATRREGSRASHEQEHRTRTTAARHQNRGEYASDYAGAGRHCGVASATVSRSSANRSRCLSARSRRRRACGTWPTRSISTVAATTCATYASICQTTKSRPSPAGRTGTARNASRASSTLAIHAYCAI